MRIISKTDHEELQRKMSAVIELLQSTESTQLLQEEFNTAEIIANREKLEHIFSTYLKQMDDLWETIGQYRFCHTRMSNILREKYRQLNRKLENNTVERQKLGLPAEGPLKGKIVLKPDALSRSRYYHSGKK